MVYEQLKSILATLGVPVYDGYPSDGAKLPYIVIRPSLTDPETVSVKGTAINYAATYTVHCCTRGVTASYNLGLDVLKLVNGYYLGGTTLQANLGYVAQEISGQFETQLTVNHMTGEL